MATENPPGAENNGRSTEDGGPQRTVRAAAVQFQHAPGDIEANLGVVGRFVERAATEKIELICFPECCLSGYWHLRRLSRPELAALAQPVPSGPACRELLKLSRVHRMTIGAGLVEVEDEKLYNSYFVALPDGRWASHRKIHAFISPHISAGDRFTVFDSPQGRLGVLTCYDNNLVENVRATALEGAEILLAPHQTGGCNSGSPYAMGVIERRIWEERETNPQAIQAELRGEKGRGWLMRWLPSRAHDNGLFLLFSNGVGPDDDEVRTGNAMIIDPYGRILAETCKAGDDMVVADLDLSLRHQATGVRWIRARRPDLYGPLAVPTGKERDTRTVRFNLEK